MRPRHVRTAAKAIIVRGGRLLAIEKRDRRGHFYILPGGGQQPGETVTAALVRECREELGALVEPGRLVAVRDYIAANHEFARMDPQFHQVEFIFECRLVEEPDLSRATEMDKGQHGFAWLAVAELESRRFYPKALGDMLRDAWPPVGAVYLGDVN